ncbi:cobalamin biosynthesis protein [Ideonella sp. DXS29W]|uniref:Cobalamin biosynthesis protein n=1 Tax=Ideonella lacteola TaxID=2984193 RepID=A0ABU9BJS3_9BURK
MTAVASATFPAAFPLAVGLGCDRGTPLETVESALERALASVGLAPAQVAVLASIDMKADEPAFLQLAERRGLPLHFYSATRLAQVPVPNPSETVRRFMGTPSVSEAAALLAASSQTLLVEKFKWRGTDGRHATVSIAPMSRPTP